MVYEMCKRGEKQKKKPKRKLNMREKKKRYEMNKKLGKPHFQFVFKPNKFLLKKCIQSILLVQIEITP
jgi:hypothetical protein